MRDVVIVDAVRTPMGRAKPDGVLAAMHPVDLLAHVLRSLVERNDIDPAMIDDVVGGCVSQAGQQSMNVTRHAVLAAGFPYTVPATTVDRQCGSSQQAAAFAAASIRSGDCDMAIACGVESMSRVPMWSSVMGQDPYGTALAARYPCESHRRAAAAHAGGVFDAGLLPVESVGADGTVRTTNCDETIRPGTTLEDLARLRPAFFSAEAQARFPDLDWKITAGNSSPLTDGAAAVLLMTEQGASRLGLRPKARIHANTAIGDDPIMMLTGVIPATRRVLARTGLSLDAIAAFEVNEAFAAVPLAWQRETGVEAERLNVFGGAIALGHPLGASGARLLGTLVEALDRRRGRYGLQTMCEAGGMANATIIERL